MICKVCATAADKKVTVAAKKRWHAKCKGCDCQHGVVIKGRIVKPSEAK